MNNIELNICASFSVYMKSVLSDTEDEEIWMVLTVALDCSLIRTLKGLNFFARFLSLLTRVGSYGASDAEARAVGRSS
jgi:hypothetical protein